jgi:NAD(P)H dehydrogenase (quinone)
VTETNQNPPTILIVFYSRDGETEALALAAAVGAVQERALIRLRRLEDVLDDESLEIGADLRRMRKEYIPPSEKDILANDAVVFAASSRHGATFPEWTHLFGWLGRLRAEGKLRGKVGGAVAAGESTLMSFSTAILNLGFITAPAGLGEGVERATAQGRQVAALARALKRDSHAGGVSGK